MAATDHDIVILGGGLAGLSLAVRLATNPTRRVLVLEARHEYPRDRTWSYWRLFDHPFRDAVANSWDSWEVVRTVGGRRIASTQTSRGLPYETIPSDRLHATARAVIARAPDVELRLGAAVGAVTEHPDRVDIATANGPVTAALCFDSRPPPARPGDLVQRFLGQEVTTSRPAFDPGRLTLMDFAVAQIPGAVRFIYVLPTSPTEALVEDTWLAPAGMALPDHREAIRRYLAERFGATDYAVGFEEQGAIPMSPGLQAAPHAGRLIAIGTAGGAVKPSSGYGFIAIQRLADALAADLAAGRRPAPFQPRGPMARWMDAVFLAALRHAPEQAPLIFQSMFARCRPEPLVRFLNDVGTHSDTAQVIASMPKWPMIAAAARRTLRG